MRCTEESQAMASQGCSEPLCGGLFERTSRAELIMPEQKNVFEQHALSAIQIFWLDKI